MYIKTNVLKPGSNAGTGLKAKSIITVVDIDDVAAFPSRDDKGVVLDGALAMKAGKYAIKIYATQDTIELTSNSEGESDNEGFIPSLKFNHPGNKKEIREFKANMLGRDLVVIVDYCDGKPRDILGSPCEPMKLQVAFTGDKDQTANELTFTQAIKGNDIGIYNGGVPYAEPLVTLAAKATTIPLSGEGEYQLTGDSIAAEISTVTGAVHGMMFTLLGAPSGTAPTIEAGGVFLLKNGATWVGGAGTSITFMAMKDGASTFKYIEQARS